MQRAGPHEGGPGRLRIARRTPRAARLRPRAAVRRERQSGCRCQRGTGRKPGVSSGAPTCRRGWLQPRRWDPSALRGKLPLAGQRLYANMTTTLREARDGVLGCSQAVAIVNHPRAARPRGAHWSPRGRSRGGPTLMPGATGVIRPRTIGWHHLSRTVARARSCARALVKNVGGEAGARSIPSSTCSSDSGAAGDGVECVGERKLEARRDPYAGRPRLLEPTPVRRSAPAARAPPSTLIPTAASPCRSI